MLAHSLGGGKLCRGSRVGKKKDQNSNYKPSRYNEKGRKASTTEPKGGERNLNDEVEEAEGE